MLQQNDPFRDMDYVLSRLGRPGSEYLTMPVDAYRRGEDVWVHIDLPGVSDEDLEISVERNVLTIAAERTWPTEEGDVMYLNERPIGAYRRQIHLGDGLDAERIEAHSADGVITLRIPVAERAKPRRIDVVTNKKSIDTTGTDTTG
jgi:HSP20 family protein